MADKQEKPKKRSFLRRLFNRPGGTTTTSVFSRTVLVMSVLGFAAFALLIAKLFQVQLVDYEVYQRNAVSQQTRNDIITPSRGTVYDRNGKQLAVSASVETVILNPAGIKDTEQSALICDGLSSILDVDYDTLVAKAAKKKSQYEYVAKKIDRKTADRVREVLTTLYNDTYEGLCGNEDVGQMSAWYILSSMGLYQVEPAGGKYCIGSPVVSEAAINVGNGKTFTVKATDNSAENMYVQRAMLNGKPYTKSYIMFSDIKQGGTLELVMGPTPSDFGTKAKERP